MRLAAALLLLIAGFPDPIAAQQATGGISGSVLADQSLRPLAGAQVGVIGTRLGALSDANGRFRVEGIVPGLRFDLGFVEGRQSRFLPKRWQEVKPLEAGQTLNVGDIRVKPQP